MKYGILLVLLFPIFFPLFTSGQTTKSDSSSLLSAFRNGKIEGRFRLYYMSTNNEEPLSDYYALAFGGGLSYETAKFKGFQLGIGGFFIWNLASSDLTIPDPHTNIMNRYEVGQFDQEDPANKKYLQRLEDFYIKYNFKKSFITYGKQVIKTPFINPQDGRMRPTGEQGFWAEINEIKKVKIELGWLTHISPRGTLKWYRGARSLGIYPPGTTIGGTKSNYKNNISSTGIAVAGITYKLNDKIKVQAWDHWVENIFNTILIQSDAEIPSGKNNKIIAGVQFVHQDAIHKGGNTDPAKTYFDPSQKANVISGRLGYQLKKTTLRFNYSRITKDGRFLFPREWGREPFYTFMPRERNEGLGNVHAFTINLLRSFFRQRVNTELSYGFYNLPDVKKTELNKYGFPSYYQVNFNVKYSFDKLLNGLNAELLYLYKRRTGQVYNDLKYVINKVNMRQVNVILNYNF